MKARTFVFVSDSPRKESGQKAGRGIFEMTTTGDGRPRGRLPHDRFHAEPKA
jgi:hypothetical protein